MYIPILYLIIMHVGVSTAGSLLSYTLLPILQGEVEIEVILIWDFTAYVHMSTNNMVHNLCGSCVQVLFLSIVLIHISYKCCVSDIVIILRGRDCVCLHTQQFPCSFQ